MDDSALTSLAIAELMRDLPVTNTISSGPQERKINPLGRPNKQFLGRTIRTALRYNEREVEKTQANCRERLQELNNKHERRYRDELRKQRSTERRESRSRSRKKHKRRRKRSPSATSSSRSSSRSSSSSSESHNKHKKKHRRKRKKQKKRKQRHRSRSRSSGSIYEENQLMPVVSEQVPASFYAPSNSLALAVAMAYSQALAARQTSLQSNEPTQPASEFSDIINELMSDEEVGQERKALSALSITSSSDEVEEVPTIDISSYSEDSPGTTASESDVSNSDSCIALDDNADNDILETSSCSDIEIIEPEPEREREPEQPNRKSEESSTVDLTQD